MYGLGYAMAKYSLSVSAQWAGVGVIRRMNRKLICTLSQNEDALHRLKGVRTQSLRN